MALVSIVLPARNEQFLSHTIKDLLEKATQDIEIFPVLDGYWPPNNEIIEDKRVKYIHFGKARGMRNAINAVSRICKGKYLMKLDAHCLVDKGFDEKLKADCEKDWVVIPRRYPLEPEKWEIEKRTDNKYPIDYQFLTCPTEEGEGYGGKEFSGRLWRERNSDSKLKAKLIDDCLSFQGSAWFMHLDYFNYLELMDEDSYGTFFKEAQEISFKAWLSGGRVVRNKKTYYAHLHKGNKYGRGYSLKDTTPEKCKKNIERWIKGKVWHKQKHEMSWLIKKFWSVPGWPQEYGK